MAWPLVKQCHNVAGIVILYSMHTCIYTNTDCGSDMLCVIFYERNKSGNTQSKKDDNIKGLYKICTISTYNNKVTVC